MKKQSFIMSDELGFFLPYVLFITVLIFMIITASIRIYQHDIEITHHLVDQLRMETIIQMGFAKFKQEDLVDGQDTLNVHYRFPDGEVTIVYNVIKNLEYRLHFTVLTNEGLIYTVFKTVK